MCTNITLKAEDNSVIIGRTMEFNQELNSNLITSSEGKLFQSPAPNGKQGLSWTAKYGYLLLDAFETGLAVDGMNEKGLSIDLLYLPGYTAYQEVPAGKEEDALDYLFVGDWVLGNFSEVDSVKDAIKELYIIDVPRTIGSIKDVTFPLHMLVTDVSGKSIVVEWLKGKMMIYDNPIGILTNSPDFVWQMTNLKNYANLSPYSSTPLKIDNIVYSGTGQGSGAVGLPGDYTPPSRFVKMSFLVKNADQVNNANDAVNLAQHILNDVDIPYGVVRGTKDEAVNDNDLLEKTEWTVFKDLKNLKLYYKSYGNTTLQEIDLKEVNFSQDSPQLKMSVDSQQIIINTTERFKDTAKMSELSYT